MIIRRKKGHHQGKAVHNGKVSIKTVVICFILFLSLLLLFCTKIFLESSRIYHINEKVMTTGGEKSVLLRGNRFDKCKNMQPKCDMLPQIQYWKSEPDCYRSPLFISNNTGIQSRTKYVVYQPDLGGWNNIRMAVEVVVVFAHATGRTLVLPPDSILYLLIKNKKSGDNKSNLDDFYDMGQLLDGLDIMTMSEFLKREAVTGSVRYFSLMLIHFYSVIFYFAIQRISHLFPHLTLHSFRSYFLS